MTRGRVHELDGSAHIQGMTTSTALMGKTADGVDITEGLIVFTNEMRVGEVRLDRVTHDGWFDVEYAPDEDGHRRRVMQDASRVATYFEGRSAQKRWDAEKANA